MASTDGRPGLSRGSVVAGKYLLLKPLAAGGMGAVWVAQHQQLDIDVAIKFMDPSLGSSSTMRTRFEREAKAAAKLRTRHVVQILDHGVRPRAGRRPRPARLRQPRLKRQPGLTLSLSPPASRQYARSHRVRARPSLSPPDHLGGSSQAARPALEHGPHGDILPARAPPCCY